MYTLTDHERKLCTQIVDAAFTVHKQMGPGLLEKIYELCFCHELSRRQIPFERQVKLPIIYQGLRLEEGLRLDVLVDKTVVCEIKAVEEQNNLWMAQLMSHLKLSGLHTGFILNFNVPLFRRGVRRICVEK